METISKIGLTLVWAALMITLVTVAFMLAAAFIRLGLEVLWY